MSPIALKNLRDAREFVKRELDKRTPDDAVISALVGRYGGKVWDSGYTGHKLRCLSVVGSCTTSRRGLLLSWSRCAGRRLERETAK